ncbi:MAG: exonuclease domain-containing protein [Lachnospiraceae bacterium]|nr:exonuclease domain-containing protein [Lachnospiraceae bacterium]
MNSTKKIEKLPFEIIEIGAVKLDDKLNLLSSFSEIIRPVVYPTINTIIHDIVNIDNKEFKSKRLFKDVITDFFNWCGKDYTFCTWGNMDLTELQRNLDYFNVKGMINGPVIYYDLQKIFSLQTIGKKDMFSLEHAIDYYNIEKDDHFHRAYYDARYAAKIMKKLDFNHLKTYYSIDCYQNPQSLDEVIFANFGTYSKYVSQEFSSKEELMEDKALTTINCYKCNRPVTYMVNWFCNSVKTYSCITKCSEHGLLKGKIRVKKAKDDKLFAIKTVSSTNEEGYKLLKNRQQLIRAKRKAKRTRKKASE